MDDYTQDDLAEALAPIASLISKSQKAQQKLRPETWQYAMLRDNLKALNVAQQLMTGSAEDGCDFSEADLQEALVALDSMASRTEQAGAKFAAGTSQHSLSRNRLKALRIAEALVRAELHQD